MKKCKTCGKDMAKNAKHCPNCGAKNKKPVYKRFWVWLIAIIMIIALFGNDSNEVNNAVITTANESGESVTTEVEAYEPTIGEAMALEKAELYLITQPFSCEGLKKQLMFEGFTDEEALFGVNNCDVDWNEQAAKKAELYLDTMAFSADGLSQQLAFEGFTDEQIQYALTSVGY